MSNPDRLTNGTGVIRHRGDVRCLICGGADDDERGEGRRCCGYLSSDGEYEHCSREEHAGGLAPDPNGVTYPHRLKGPCRCGREHGPAPAPTPARKGKPSRRGSRVVARYNYPDADDKLVMQVERTDPKGFRQRRPDPDSPGGWVYDLKGVLPPLYRLPELLAADPAEVVFVCEGEKDVELLRSFGLTATTCPMGAGKWRPHHTESLRGRHVVILADNDAAGRKHAEQVARSLHGVAASVKIVYLPGLAEHGDVSDWIAAGGTRDELIRLAEAAPEWTPAPEPTAEANGHANGNGNGRVNRILGFDSPVDLDARLAKLPRTDLGNAERLVERHGADLRYCHPWKTWLVYDGIRWREDDTAEIHRRGKDTVRKILAESATLNDDDRVKAHVAFAFTSEKRARLEALIALAASEPGVPILPDQLDRDPWLFNCPNGTIDLRTGELRKHRRSDLITRCSPTAYDPHAECPLWESTLRLIFNENERLIAYLQRFSGYALTGLVRDHCFPICHGSGANGKSTFLNALLDTWGPDYSMKASADLLMLRRSDGHPTATADLFGRRLVVCIETGEGRRINETFIKEACGGDRIRARRLYQDSFEFTPSHKLLLATNHAPHVVGTDHGFWRRVNMVPFSVTLGPDQADTTVPERLRAEASGILSWAVRGALAWQETGLRPPDEVQAATQQYRESEDVLGAFLAECCFTGSGDFKVRATPLYFRYREWAEASGETPTSQRKFGQALRERGFESYPNNGIWYRGIGLREVDKGDPTS